MTKSQLMNEAWVGSLTAIRESFSRETNFILSLEVPKGVWKLRQYVVPSTCADHFKILSFKVRGRELMSGWLPASDFSEKVSKPRLSDAELVPVTRGDLIEVTVAMADDLSVDFASAVVLERYSVSRVID